MSFRDESEYSTVARISADAAGVTISSADAPFRVGPIHFAAPNVLGNQTVELYQQDGLTLYFDFVIGTANEWAITIPPLTLSNGLVIKATTAVIVHYSVPRT
jgi:hypothetical protein